MLWRMPGKKIYLTFDDGPHSLATPAILDVLKRHHVHATFFLSGKNIAGREDIVRRIVNEGHSIGIHAFHHRFSLAFSKDQTKREILQTEEILFGLTQQRMRLFRPPYGFFTWKTVAAVRELDYLLVMWSCLTGDFRKWTNEKVIANALHKLSHGSILVFHDNHLTYEKIAELIDTVIPEIQKRGFEFGAIR